MLTIIIKIFTILKIKIFKIQTLIHRQYDQHKMELDFRIPSKFKDERENSTGIRTLKDDEAHPFLFVLDELTIFSKTETQTGISFMTAIRRALHFLPPSNYILFVTLGTNCDVSVLSKAVWDNSLRFKTRRNLLFPLLFPGSWDIFYHEFELHKLVIDVNLLENKKTLLLLVSLGLGLWSSILVIEVFNIAKKTNQRIKWRR